MVVAIAAAALGFNGFYTGLCYGIFYATLGFLGVHILLNAIDEDARQTKSLPNSLANT